MLSSVSYARLYCIRVGGCCVSGFDLFAITEKKKKMKAITLLLSFHRKIISGFYVTFCP